MRWAVAGDDDDRRVWWREAWLSYGCESVVTDCGGGEGIDEEGEGRFECCW